MYGIKKEKLPVKVGYDEPESTIEDGTDLREGFKTTGIDTEPKAIKSNNFVTGSAGWRFTSQGDLEANSGTFRGSLIAGDLHIPDQDTTANSFHTDTSGNTWWGATETNFTANNDNANAYILNTGVAKFQNVDVTGAVTINSGSGIANLSDAGALAILNTVGTTQIDALAVNDTKIASNAVTVNKIATDAVTSAKILAGAVDSSELAAGAVIAGKITAGTIVAADIATGTITSNEIDANTIVAGNIAAGTITANEMTVAQLSAISADLGTINAGSISINSGVASISSAGAAVFKSIKVGGSTTQYTLSDDGMFSYGDGSDGALTTTGDVTLTEDKYYTDLTISDGDTFNPAGYRVFVSGTLTVGGGASGTISRNGSNGTAGGNGDSGFNGLGGAGGAALADGYLKGSVAGADGGDGGGNSLTPPTASTGTSTSNSIGSNGVVGGVGGDGSAGSGASSTAGTATTSNVKLIANWHLATLLDISSSGSTIKYDNSAGTAGGGGGAGATEDGTSPGSGGGGGGAGSCGGIIAIYARKIVINSGGVIEANGGNGANGGNAWDQTSIDRGGGGGGGGANGGQIILVYNEFTNNGSITVTAGTAGTGGSGANSGTAGASGTAGTVGSIRQFNISL